MSQHLFVYYTTNRQSSDRNNIGGSNRDVTGWKQISNVIFPGTVVTKCSIVGEDQYETRLIFRLRLGKWWLTFNDELVGHYPPELVFEFTIFNFIVR